MLIALSIVLAAVAVLVIRTLRWNCPERPARTNPPEPPAPGADVLARLSGAIAIPTVSVGGDSHDDTAGSGPPAPGQRDRAPFREFIAYLRDTWPLFHEKTESRLINGYTLLYRLPGTDSGLPPLILTAHYDVVPVEPEPAWTWPGFSGKIAGGRVWGRGTLDIKSQLCAHLEAVEALLRRGWRPARDFYFIYGHDEEIGGREGALKAAEYLAAEGIRAEGLLDEGGFVISGAFRGVAAPMALIGVAEKGFCNYEITVEGEGGHSSMPPRHSSLGTAAALIRAIEEHPMPYRLCAPVLEMLRAAVGELGFFVRMALANLWLFRPVLFRILAASPASRAMIGTSLAATVARAGNAANVLPLRTTVIVNARILPGDSVARVERHIARLADRVVARDGGLQGQGYRIRKLVPQEASAVSPAAGPFYERLRTLSGAFFPNAIIAPYLVMGGTDARKYQAVCDHIYRFTPVLINDDEKNSAHGVDESISAVNYGRMIRFFERFIGEYDPA